MGEDLGRPQIPNLHLDFSPFLLNPVNLEQKIGLSSFIHHNSNVVLANEAFPVHTSSELLPLPLPLPQWRQTTGVDEPQGWFYCLPRFRQATMPDLNTIIKDKVGGKSENCRGRERRFLVVDHSPDRTTLIFSSPLQCLGSWRPKVDGINNMNSKEDFIAESKWINDFDGKEKTDAEGVMEEDSEELNALLYSDNEEEERESNEEDEVTSTGHSPSTIMTSYDKEDQCTNEVASSYGPIRKRKAFDTHEIDVSSPPNYGEDDAESWCGGGRRDGESEEMGPKDGFKKMRKERVEEIIGILQSIVPCSHGKEAVLVIDESIRYLKYLRSSKPWL